jgi:hypothetical protein
MIIVDLDNCISDDNWRIGKINWQKQDPDDRFHDYHSLSGFDELKNRHVLDAASGIIVMTARPSTFRAVTEEWLRRNDVIYDHLIMRNNNDHRTSAELKMAMVKSLGLYGINTKDIKCAYDDRTDVVLMYESLGLVAETMWIHIQQGA